MRTLSTFSPILSAAFLAGVLLLPGGPAGAAEPATPPQKPTDAKICLNCHKPETGNLRGHWENVAMKSSTIQLKIDDRSEVVKFDPDDLKILNTDPKEPLEKALRSIKKGHEVRIAFTEKDGVKTASQVSAKPAVKLAAEDKISLAEVEKLVAQGPEKGNYALFDSRPAPRFKEGAIPTAVSLPYPEFDKFTDRLPADKSKLVIFYCSGVTCNMSPGSQKKAKTLGYTNIKVFVEGIPAWMTKNYGVLSALSLNDAYKDRPIVLLDARLADVAKKGFIKGAVTFPSASEKALAALPKKELKAPIIVYDENGTGNAVKVATAIVKAGYVNVMVLSGGLAGWQQANLPVETGELATKVVYVPKLKPGEIPVEEFKKLAAKTPANVLIVDVRNPDEASKGMIKGAKNIPVDALPDHLTDIPKDKEVVLQCNTGVRAEMGYNILKDKGFTNVKYLNATVEVDKDGKATIQ